MEEPSEGTSVRNLVRNLREPSVRNRRAEPT
jgi:hypothetical protein